ncbi:hypothetical protein C5167_031477 [Papaver somniferum]|uniref:Uncharacterized protein n=1 Tax=Papaver somniferum TaxID=3469 RepID=A0A4Y7K8G4_PAPSO|nr:indole-3-acetic acid-amido synthetase GH3.6-like [Papaver somniferum]RZC68219.1 hypothetical protein C5167_031477 [Papaver somniferum]
MEATAAIYDSVAVKNSSIANTCTNNFDERNHDEKNKEELQFIEEVTINADKVQNKVLTEILSRNAQVEYLQRHGLDGYTDWQTFKRVMPLVSYEDVKTDIDLLITKGNISSILCASPVSQFLHSTGTSSGVSKLMPTT